MRTVLFLSGCLFLAACATPSPRPCVESACHLVVLHTNDTHGHPVPFELFPNKGVGGLPARKTLVDRERSQEKNLLVLDAGDINTGRPESMLFDARPDIEGYNAIGYDAFTIGNHELTRSLEVLEKQRSWAKFPFLSANITLADGSPLPGVRPYVIREVGGFRVAIFGLTTPEVAKTGNPEVMGRLKVADPVTTARALVPELRKQAELVIALTHLGLDEEQMRGSRVLARDVEGIDLVVDGHSHTKIEAPVMVKNLSSGVEVPIVQAWEWGLQLGRTEISFQKGQPAHVSFKALSVNNGPTATQNVAQDPGLQSALQKYVTETEARLSETVGSLPSPLDNGRVRFEETAIGNLVADACLETARPLGAQFSIQNAGAVRMPLPQGALTRKAVMESLPFDNTIVLVTLTGEQLQELFDFATTIPLGKGAFPILAGVSVTLDGSSHKATRILVDGKPLRPKASYRLATNSYLAAGGDGYAIFKQGANKYDTSLFIRDAVLEHVRKLAKIPLPEGRLALRNYTEKK